MGLTGFIGLGHMGEGMARQLQAKGHKLAVYDVRNEPVEGLVSMGAENAGSVAGVAWSHARDLHSMPSESAAGRGGLPCLRRRLRKAHGRCSAQRWR